MNTIMVVDLHHTLQDPFQARGKRKIFYVSYFVLSIIINCIGLGLFWGDETGAGVFSDKLVAFLLTFKILVMITAFIYFGKVIIRLRIKGTSMKLRKRILWRNLIYFFLFFYIAAAECGNLSVSDSDCGTFPFSVCYYQDDSYTEKVNNIVSIVF